MRNSEMGAMKATLNLGAQFYIYGDLVKAGQQERRDGRTTWSLMPHIVHERD
jgi:hypothetical protein